MLTAAAWAAILDGAELVEVPDLVRTAAGETRTVARRVLAEPDPVCVRCGQPCAACASALPPGYQSVQRPELRDDAYPSTQRLLVHDALRQLEPPAPVRQPRRPRRLTPPVGGGRA